MSFRFLITIILSLAFLVSGCGGGGGGGGSNDAVVPTSPAQPSPVPVAKIEVRGYVTLDRPVQGATIEIYNENGKLLYQKQNATDNVGYFSITLQDLDAKILKVVAKNGVIGGNNYIFTFKNYLPLQDSKDVTVYVTPFTTVASDLIGKLGLQLSANTISKYKQITQKVLGIPDLKVVPKEFALYLLASNNIDAELSKISDAILEGSYPDEKLSQIFPNSSIFKPTIKISVDSNFLNYQVITNSNQTDVIVNTSSLIDAAVINDKGDVVAVSVNIPSLKGKLNSETTAFSILSLGLKDYFSLSNIQLQEIYDAIKENQTWQKFLKLVDNKLKEGIALRYILEDAEISSLLSELYKDIFQTNIQGILGKNNLEGLTRNNIDETTNSFVRANIEWFSYPAFKFEFNNSTDTAFTGNVEFKVTNPTYVGYGFLDKELFLESLENTDKTMIDRFEEYVSTLYVPFSKPFGKIPSFKEIFNTGKRATFKSLGKSELWSSNLQPYVCTNDDCLDSRCKKAGVCWIGNFVAYDELGLNKPTLFNAVSLFDEITSLLPKGYAGRWGEDLFKKLKVIHSKFDEVKLALLDFYRTLRFFYDVEDLSLQLHDSLVELVTNDPAFLEYAHVVKDNMHEFAVRLDAIEKELIKLVSPISGFIKKFNLSELPKEQTNICSSYLSTDSIEFLEKANKALSSGDVIGFLFSLVKDDAPKDIKNFIICQYMEQKVSYYPKGSQAPVEERVFDFIRNKKISKGIRGLVAAYYLFKVLKLEETGNWAKNFSRILEDLMKVNNIQLKNPFKNTAAKTNLEIPSLKRVIEATQGMHDIIEFFNSWYNRGFYVDWETLKENLSNIGQIFLKSMLLDLAANADNYFAMKVNAIFDVSNIRQLSDASLKRALFAVDVAKVGTNVSYMIGSYFANPKAIPYRILAVKNPEKGRVDFYTDVSFKSIGYSKPYFLDVNQDNIIKMITDQFNTPLFIMAKDSFEFNPSMQIIFPRGLLREYFEKTLFIFGNYPYSFRLWVTDNLSDNSTLALWLGVSSSEEYEEANYLEYLYTYYFGENDAYVNKVEAPRVLVNNIRTLKNNYEYIDVYDILHSGDPSVKYGFHASDYVSLHKKKIYITKPGYYRIRMQTLIDQPYTSYIKNSKVVPNTWAYVANVLVLSSINKADVENTLSSYSLKIYKNENEQVTSFKLYFPGLCDTATSNPWEQLSLVNLANQVFDCLSSTTYVVFPYVDGVLYSPAFITPRTYTAKTPISDGSSFYVYVMSSENYNLLNAANVDIDKNLLEQLVKKGIVYKKKLTPRVLPQDYSNIVSGKVVIDGDIPADLRIWIVPDVEVGEKEAGIVCQVESDGTFGDKCILHGSLDDFGQEHTYQVVVFEDLNDDWYYDEEDSLWWSGKDLSVEDLKELSLKDENENESIESENGSFCGPHIVAEFPVYKGGNRSVVIGKENYLYIGGDGLYIVDVSKPRNPRLRGSLPGDVVFDIAISKDGNKAYLVGFKPYTGDGILSIVDVSDKDNPKLIKTINLGRGEWTTAVAVYNNYIYVGGRYKTFIVDVSDMDNVKVAFIQIPSSSIKISGHYAYLCSGKVKVLDISNPMWPQVVGDSDKSCTDLAFEDNSLDNFGFAIDSGVFYVIDLSSNKLVGSVDMYNPADLYVDKLHKLVYVLDILETGPKFNIGLRIVDVSNPKAPYIVNSLFTEKQVYAGAVKDNYLYMFQPYLMQVLDASTLEIRNELEKPSSYISDVVIEGDKIYTPTSDGLYVYDISDPVNPSFITRIEGGKEATSIDIVDNYAFITFSHFGSTSFSTYHYLSVYDISSLTDLKLLGKLESGLENPVSIKVLNDYAYIADSWGGLKALNVAAPSNLENSVVYTIENGDIRDIAIKDNILYAAEEKTLKVIDISNPLRPETISTLVLDEKAYNNTRKIATWNNYVIVSSRNVFEGITIVDVSNLYSPKITMRIALNGIKDIYVSGNYLYVFLGHYAWRPGVVVIDLPKALSCQLDSSEN